VRKENIDLMYVCWPAEYSTTSTPAAPGAPAAPPAAPAAPSASPGGTL